MRRSTDPMSGAIRGQVSRGLESWDGHSGLREAAGGTFGPWRRGHPPIIVRRMRTESVLRKTLHHPLVYVLVAVVAFFAAGGIGPAVGSAVAVWFVTALIP